MQRPFERVLKGALVSTIVAILTIFASSSAFSQDRRVIPAERVNRSEALRDMPVIPPGPARAPFAIPNKFWRPATHKTAPDQPDFVDPVRQAAEGPLASASVLVNFEGSSDDDNAAILGYRVVPPDVEGDVGPNHYVEWINLIAEIFDKNGNSIMGPFPGNQFFQGLGGKCETTNDGDPVVLYDHLADRWLVSQFAVDGGAPYYECVAVSVSPDPTGAYYQYAFPFGSDFPDYPKLGVWSDAYYMTTRAFPNGGSYAGVQAVAFDRGSILSGAPAAMVVHDVPGGTQNDGWQPADLDGPAPPGGTPGLFAGAPETSGSNEIQLWQLDVDWSNPGVSSFTQVATLPTTPFDISVYSVSQPPPGESLDALPWFLMYRMQYRNFGLHQSLVLNHTVDVGGNRAGIRWYELRNNGGGWSLYQEGTFAPDDGHSRWMGSIAMNGNGDIGLAYSISSSTLFPSIRFTGQTAANSGTGVMDVAETEIIAGSGVQASISYNRWGDYTTLSIDPSDGETFWYAGEYYANTASFDFKTRIASFQLGAGTPPPEPTSVHVSNIETAQTGGGRDKQGTATVTISDDNGGPVSGAFVEGTFSGNLEGSASGTTGADGTVTLVTPGSKAGKVSVSFCVDSVSASLPYEPADNTDPAYACVSEPPPPAGTTMHVASVSTGQKGVGKGDKVGTADVTIEDENGTPVAGVDVTGDFSGDFTETHTETTDGSGIASFQTTGTTTGKVNVGFCVSDVTGGSLTYEPADNAAGTTCPSSASKLKAADSTPDGIALGQNYPNPFNPSTIITYDLDESVHVSLKVFNMLGQEVATLVDEVKEGGSHSAIFFAEDLTPGVYIYVMSTDKTTITRRMTLLK